MRSLLVSSRSSHLWPVACWFLCVCIRSPPVSWLLISFCSSSSHLLACLIPAFLCCFGNLEWYIYSGNLHGRSLVLCLLEIITKTLLFLLVFVIWSFLDLLFFHWLCFFAVLGNMSFFLTFETFPGFTFFLLWSASLCHMSIFVVIETFGLPVFKVVIELPNVHGLTSPSASCSCSCLVIVSSFHGLILLFYWHYSHLSLLECF